MKFDTHEFNEIARAQPAPRMDLYAGIHKALRALMVDTLHALGRVDTQDDLEVAQASERAVELLAVCAGHLQHENDFIHVALEERAPGSSSRIGHEHGEHEHHIAQLSALATSLMSCPRAARAGVAHDLYHRLSLFVAHNFEHMYFEETAHNAVLWACYSDEELAALEGRLVASLPPEEMLLIMRWMVPALSHGERVGLLSSMRANAPAPVFGMVLGAVQPHLNQRDWGKLSHALGLPAAPGLATA